MRDGYIWLVTFNGRKHYFTNHFKAFKPKP